VSKEKVGKVVRYALMGLPLAGAGLSSFLPISVRSQQFLVLVTLLWLQIFTLFEVFSVGK
jgi:hypothetical protein